MKSLALGIMSDLHIGKDARSKDLCPHAKGGPKVEMEYKKHFLRFIKDNEISVDYLLLPGDVTNEGQPAEVELASELVIDRVCDIKEGTAQPEAEAQKSSTRLE